MSPKSDQTLQSKKTSGRTGSFEIPVPRVFHVWIPQIRIPVKIFRMNKLAVLGGGGVCCTSQITKEFLCQKKFQIFVNFQKKKNFFFCFQKKFKVSRQSFWKCRADSKSMKKIQKI